MKKNKKVRGLLAVNHLNDYDNYTIAAGYTSGISNVVVYKSNNNFFQIDQNTLVILAFLLM